MITIKNWSTDHSEKILELLKNELKWEIDLKQATSEDILDVGDFKKTMIHKFEISESPKLLVHYPAQPERVQLLESMDCLIDLQGKQWPELLLAAAVKRALRRKVNTLDLNQAAYVVGENATIRPLVMAATELGFSRVCLVSKDPKWLEVEKKFLSRRLVGIQIENVLITDLTLQPQDTNLLLNALDLNLNKDYLQDLAYFNFMVSGGVVVDLFSEGLHQTLQEEAGKAQLTCVKPDSVLLAWWLELALKVRPALPFTKENESNLFKQLEFAGPVTGP